MERRDWTVSQRAVAYLVCDGIVNSDKYYPQEIAEWARDLMVGEGRVGIELIRGALEERSEQHTTLVEQRDLLARALSMITCGGCQNRIGWNETPSKYGDWRKCSSCKAARAALATVEQGGEA